MTAQATGRAPAGEAGFRLLAEHLPDLILLAFDDDPSRLWAFTFVPVPDERAAVTGGMVIARDITEQRRAERQILASRRQLAEAQRIAQVGSWEWDLVSDHVILSDEFCRMLGYPPGSTWTMREGMKLLIPQSDMDRIERLHAHMRTDPTPYAYEHRMIAKDGTIRTLLARGEGVVDGDGRVVRFIGTTQDITDRRRAEAERRRLLGRVYEAQEGQDRRLAADLHDGHVQSPRRTIGRLRPLVLVEDGLEAALREEAKSACNHAALVACEVVSELEARFDPVVETALFRVAQQALANIVDHASATRALVAIECFEEGVVLRVSDDGRGFDPDHVQVLADIAHFGLIAMRERVEALGGRFRVTTAPGEGTVVEARLPLTDPTEGLRL